MAKPSTPERDASPSSAGSGPLDPGVDEQRSTLRAIPVGAVDDVPIPAPAHREWMDNSDRRFAYRCLPLSIANQSGWLLTSDCDVTIHWSGGTSADSLSIDVRAAAGPIRPFSHFGHGIFTWTIPYIFQTTPGFDLHVSGPTNWPKDGAYPLSAVVETDWFPATFTMNWLVTRPHHPIEFAKGEPVCMIAPRRRADLEQVEPTVGEMSAAQPLLDLYTQWHESRIEFITELRERSPRAVERGWQKDYYRGRYLDGSKAPEHRTRMRLRHFRRLE